MKTGDRDAARRAGNALPRYGSRARLRCRRHGLQPDHVAPSGFAGEVDKRKIRAVGVYHLSWWRIITEAVLQHRFRGVSDPDQAWILGELIAYLDHESSGASGFQDMGEAGFGSATAPVRAPAVRRRRGRSVASAGNSSSTIWRSASPGPRPLTSTATPPGMQTRRGATARHSFRSSSAAPAFQPACGSPTRSGLDIGLSVNLRRRSSSPRLSPSMRLGRGVPGSRVAGYCASSTVRPHTCGLTARSEAFARHLRCCQLRLASIRSGCSEQGRPSGDSRAFTLALTRQDGVQRGRARDHLSRETRAPDD